MVLVVCSGMCGTGDLDGAVTDDTTETLICPDCLVEFTASGGETVCERCHYIRVMTPDTSEE